MGYIMKTLNEISKMVHELAIEKGWYDKKETDDEFVERTCNNLHDEVSELHTAWRENNLHNLCDKAQKMVEEGMNPLTYCEEELADIIIRAMDSAERLGVDIENAVLTKHRFNKTRPIRHGGKRS